MPKLKHPESKQTITVSPASVAMYASQGWVEVKSSPKKATAAKADGK